MTARNNDNVGPGRYNNNKPAKDGPPGRGRTRRTGTVRIAGHETRTMTPEQYDNAVEALAVLVRRWLDYHPSPCPDCTADDQPDSGSQVIAA